MEVVKDRRATGAHHPDMLQTFMQAEYLDGSKLPDELIPGRVVWIMFASFHTSSNTAAWTMVELARNHDLVPEWVDEVDSIYGDNHDLSLTALREIPLLERFVFEVLRLHPPLVTLMRRVLEDFEYKGNVFSKGDTLQIKAIFCALLSRFEFEVVGSPEAIVDWMPSLILRPSEPCQVRYRRRC